MPTGVSSPYYPLVQPAPAWPLEADNTYFLIRIHDSQAFFPANALTQVDHLLFRSSVESSFNKGNPTQSLYKLKEIEKNKAFHLGVAIELTDWLPARTTDTVKITLNFSVMRGAPIKALGNKLDELHLASKISLLRPDIAVAVKVTEIAGQLFSYFLHEGEAKDIFSWTIDFNLARLKSGFYVVVGSLSDEIWPRELEIDAMNHLGRPGGQELSRLSYVIIEVVALNRRGLEAVRNEAWGELLLTAREEILATHYATQEDREDSLQDWRANLAQIRALARKESSFLQVEIDEVIAATQQKIEEKLLPKTASESYTTDSYPENWQKLLGVNDRRELQKVAHDYQDSLKLSAQLLERYKLREANG